MMVISMSMLIDRDGDIDSGGGMPQDGILL